MTVKELREAIAEYPDDFLVILSRDAEGNGYAPADAVLAQGHYDASELEFLHHPEDNPKPPNAVCLWPE